MTFMARLDKRGFEQFLKDIAKRHSKAELVKAARATALSFLQVLEAAPVPSDTGALLGSYTVVPEPGAGRVSFGFNIKYAFVQDGDRLKEIIIRPVRKKLLYVPLTRKGRKHREGQNPRDEGLERGVDYILTKQVRIPVKAYGSVKGPNQYFTGTLKRKRDFLFQGLARRVGEKLPKVKRT